MAKFTERIISKYISNVKSNIVIIFDSPYSAMAASLADEYEKKRIQVCTVLVDTQDVLFSAIHHCVTTQCNCLILIEPHSYVKFELWRNLDFTFGAPKVARLIAESYVSVFPYDSAVRLYTSDGDKDLKAKCTLIENLKDNKKYHLATELGTNIDFTSRLWLVDSDEVLTAPIEETISGIIVVDEAVFFRRAQSPFTIHIENGLIVDIASDTLPGKELVQEYLQMTHNDFTNVANKQLAEIGLGYNTGTIISDCFMEAETVYETCHFCFGNNTCYVGHNESDFHGGSVLIKSPKLQCLD